MDYKKILIVILSIIWVSGVLYQQLCWINTDNYNIGAFIICLIELFAPYILIKSIKEVNNNNGKNA